MSGLRVLAPMRLEARALRRGCPSLDVRRIGIGPRRAARGAAAATGSAPAVPVVLVGFGGGVDPRLAPGDVVVADALSSSAGDLRLPDPAVLAAWLRRAGVRVHVGTVHSTARPVHGGQRAALLQRGVLAVDMEAAAVVPALGDRPLAVLRVVLDSPEAELHRPLRVLRAYTTARRTLARLASLLETWAAATGERELLLASPRASCAGVERAIAVVERALADRGAPVFVRKQIVHNAHVIEDLECRGAVFVDELDEVPPGATVIFSAHGVSPAVRAHAGERELNVIDATCPLVAKVHAEARRLRERDFDIVLIGHEGHEEIEGTFGEVPERTHIVADVEAVQRLEVRDPQRVGYLTQTTLAQDDTATIVAALHARFPQLVGPPSSDICYATQNRQDAVRALAPDCDLLLVIGSANSSNSRRLVEVAERSGARALLLDDAGQLDPGLLAGARRIGVTAGASAPEQLVQDVVRALSGLGAVSVHERRVAVEDVRFKLPVDLRGSR